MKVTVCMGSQCVMMGSMNIMSQLEELKSSVPELNLEIEMVKCLGQCKGDDSKAPIVKVDDKIFTEATSQDIMAHIMEKAGIQ